MFVLSVSYQSGRKSVGMCVWLSVFSVSVSQVEMQLLPFIIFLLCVCVCVFICCVSVSACLSVFQLVS